MKKELIDEAKLIADNGFKKNARLIAIEKAVNLNSFTGLKRNADDIIEDAEKIYQWLIK
jgi:hypothetical protein